jgi:hypothetical protein
MNAHARWRLDLARKLSIKLHHLGGIQAIIVGGSVARGYSDAYSDLELILLWDQPPSPTLRRAIIADLRAEFRYPAIDPSHESALLIDDFPVDLWHITVASQLAAMRAVLEEHSIELDASNILDTIRACVPLYGVELVQQWKQRVAAYPEAVAIGFLQTYLPHFHLRQLHLAAHRDNPTTFYQILAHIQCSLFLNLLALNRSYFPTFKWMYHVLGDMPLAPPQVAPRLRQMLGEPPLRALTLLHGVLAETLALAEEQYPELDTAYARYRLDDMPTPYALPR